MAKTSKSGGSNNSDLFGKLHKALSDHKNIFVSGNDRLRKLDRSLASAEAGVFIDSGRTEALADLSEGEMNRTIKKVLNEESEVQKALAFSYNMGTQQLQSAMEDYTKNLSELYWKSTKISTGLGARGKDIIEKEYIPEIELIINQINKDPLFNDPKLSTKATHKAFRDPLLKYANKIKSELEKRVSISGRLGSTVKSLVRSDVVAGVLAGAASKNALVGLAAFAFKQRTRTNSYASRVGLAQKGLRMRKESTSRALNQQDELNGKVEALKNSEASEAPGGLDTISNAKGDKGGDGDGTDNDGKAKSSLFGGSSIEKILSGHTKLFRSIYGNTSDILKLLQNDRDQRRIDEEESSLESSDDKTASLVKDTADEANDENGGPFKNLFGKFKIGKIFGKLKNIINLFGKFRSLGMIVTRVIGSMSALATPLLVVGAAFAGWKIGKMIDKWTGASDKVASLASWFAEKLGFKEKNPSKEELDSDKLKTLRHNQEQAQKRSGGKIHAKAEDWTLEEAVKYLAEGESAQPPTPSPTSSVSNSKNQFGGDRSGGGASGNWNSPSATPASPTPPSSATPTASSIGSNLSLISATLNQKGINDPNYVNAVLGNVMKESGGKINEEQSYAGTANQRIRTIFGARTKKYSDAELTLLKQDKTAFFEAMYGKDTPEGRRMGNTQAGDGWKYRGRGFIQLTGKTNYANYSKFVFGDGRLVTNPDLMLNPQVAAQVTVEYMQRGKSSMAKRLGIDLSKPLSQEQASLLTTSQIAGVAIKPGQGYLGTEALNKVAQFSGSMEQQGRQLAAQGLSYNPPMNGNGGGVVVNNVNAPQTAVNNGSGNQGMPIVSDPSPTLRSVLG